MSTNVTYTSAVSPSIDFRIGSYNGDGFDGKLDEVRFANKAFSAARISTEYNNQNSASTFYSTTTPEVL